MKKRPFQPRGMTMKILSSYIKNILILSFLVLVACSGQGKKIYATGTIEATEVNVSSKVNGEIKEFFVEEGSQVKSGDRLLQIDPSDWEIQLNQTQAGVDVASAQLRLLTAGTRKEDLSGAEEAMKQAKANYESADTDAKRMRELFKTKSITDKQKDDAETRYTVAWTTLQQAEQNYHKLKEGARIEDLDAARARVKQAEALRDAAQKKVNDCKIIAPISGTVTHQLIEKGEFVNVGSQLVTISELSKVKLNIYLTEKEIGRIQLNQSAEIKIDAFQDKTFLGKVVYISPSAEFTPKNIQTKDDRVKLVFAVKVEIDNSEGALKPGLPADAILTETVTK